MRIGLTMDNVPTFHRDALLLGLFVSAKSHESMGLARLALAQYLDMKAGAVVRARRVEGRPKRRVVGADNVVREFNLIDEIYAYDLALRQCDPEVIRSKAVRLYDEVISDYADIPHITRIGRERERS